MIAQCPTDFHDRAAHYRELAACEENEVRASVLFELANLFDRMAQDFAEYFPRQPHRTH